MSTPGSSSVIIRPAERADLPAIGRLGALLVAMHHELDPRRFLSPSASTPQDYADFLGSQLERANVVVLVAEREGSVVGYAFGAVESTDWMSLRGPAGMLHDIVVDPSVRRGGVGWTLLDAALRALEAHGVPRVVLSAAARNEPAQRLFARAGFRQTMIEMTRERGGAA
jgi:ribosomal protein S18 acetylase RimI-like enzyme